MEFNLDFIAYRMLDPDIKYLSGHFPFNEKIYNDFKDSFDFFTILRDPVEKWLSNFYYRGKRYSLIKKSKVKHWEVEDDVESYLDSDRGQFHGYDYAKYYGGIREDYDYTSRESIEMAKENLSKFKVVGILEDLNGFKLQMKNFYGFDIDVKHRNKSRSTQVGKGLSQNILENIKEVCKADIEIYEYAKGLNKI
jgi:hypothetical protein